MGQKPIYPEKPSSGFFSRVFDSDVRRLVGDESCGRGNGEGLGHSSRRTVAFGFTMSSVRIARVAVLLVLSVVAAMSVARVASLSDEEAMEIAVEGNKLFYDLYESKDYEKIVEDLYCSEGVVR